MNIHSLLPIIISVLGIYSGTYIILNIKKVGKDTTLKIFFCVLGGMYIYIGIIYTLVFFGVIGAIPPTQASILMRPINILAIVTPFMIAKRMGL